MLEAMICVFLAISTMFIVLLGIALEKRIDAQRDYFHAEARFANTNARISELYLHKQRMPRRPVRGGLPESMNPLAPAEPSFPRI